MDKKRKELKQNGGEPRVSAFPDEVLERVLGFVKSHKERSAVSLVCKDWYNAERWSRTHVFIGDCHSVSPEILIRRFPNIRSVTLKGKPCFSGFHLDPPNWGADVHYWFVAFSSAYPFLEELRLQTVHVLDESLEYLARSFSNFRALSLFYCFGFSNNGLDSIAAHCRNLTELFIQKNWFDNLGCSWLSCFPESFTSLEILDSANLSGEVRFDAFERLVARCKSLKVLKVNKNVTLEQLQRLLVRAPQLLELGTGSFFQELSIQQYAELGNAFNNCKNLHTLSGLWEATSLYLPVLYPACMNLTFLNLRCAALESNDLANLLPRCPNLRCLWVLETVQDKGLEAVAFSCKLLQELRVFASDPYDLGLALEGEGVTESGIVAISQGCRKLRYLLYFCRRMTNAAVETVVRNCPDFIHFRLCIMDPYELDYKANEPMDEAFGAVVKTCTKLQRLAVSGPLTDQTFEYIGKYAKNLERLSVASVGSSDRGFQCVLEGCPKLRKLEIRESPSGNFELLTEWEMGESTRSLWTLAEARNVTINMVGAAW